MNILVTGGTGFIGSHLVKALAQKEDNQISVIKRSGSDFQFDEDTTKHIKIHELSEDCDNLNDIIQNSKPDIVVHLASLFLSNHKPDDVRPLMQSNVTFPSLLLESMAKNGVTKFLNTGTNWEYFGESTEYDPVNLYAATKKAFEDILQYYVNVQGFSAITIKFFDTYGPNDQRPKLFSILRKNIEDHKVLDFSPGEQTLDLLYVDDVVDAYIKAIEYLKERVSGTYDSFTIGSGKSVKLKEIVSVYEKVYDKKVNIRWGGRPYREREVMSAQADIQEAKDTLEWSPRISLEEGLQKVMSQESRS